MATQTISSPIRVNQHDNDNNIEQQEENKIVHIAEEHIHGIENDLKEIQNSVLRRR